MFMYVEVCVILLSCALYRGADKSLARPGRKQARKHVRDARHFNNIETRAVIKFFFLQGKAPKEFHDVLTSGVPRERVWGVQTTPEILKALQNCAKFNPIVKTVKNC